MVFSSLGFVIIRLLTDNDKDIIFGALKAILLLGNICFHEETFADGTGADIGTDYSGLLSGAAQILGLDYSMLRSRLISRSLTIRSETTQIKFLPVEAQDALNALCKEIYGRIFSYIVYQANKSLMPSTSTTNSVESSPAKLSIGLLDIFGFEKFKSNSFEQLCINYANEKLHQYFISFVLKKEQELYIFEEVPFANVVPIDNSDVLSLFEHKQIGIFSRLDDEIKLPKCSDESFLKKVENDHNTKDPTRRFVKDVKMPGMQFEIKHFAGTIRYDAIGFLEKNKDKLYDHLEEMLGKSCIPKFREIITTDWEAYLACSSSDEIPPVVQSVSTASITTRFQGQLQRLVDILDHSQPHFIKCIKPNNNKQERVIEKDVVLQQLRYSGVLEAIQIRKSGYPTRRPHERFWKQYWMIPGRTKLETIHPLDDRSKCYFIVERLQGKFGEIQIGKSLVFLRPNSVVALENEKQRREEIAVISAQKLCKKKQAVALYRKMCKIRDALHDAIGIGEECNSSNIEAIDDLERSIANAKYVGLPFRWISAGEVLLQRLIQIKDTLEKLEMFAQSSGELNFSDVFEEYQALQTLLAVAKSLKINSPELINVYERLNSLRERAELVEALRDAVEIGDDIMVRQCLKSIVDLKKQFGSFCVKDEMNAENVVDIFEEDFHCLEETMVELSNFETRFCELISGKSINQENLSTLFVTFSGKVKQKMKLWSNRTPGSLIVKGVIEIIQTIQHLHSAWIMQDWATVASLLEKASKLATNCTSCFPLSLRKDTLQSYSSMIHTVLMVEAKSIEKDIHSNFLIPMWLKAINIGPAKLVAGTIKIEDVEVQKLKIAITETRGYSWLSRETDPAFKVLNYLLEVRSMFLDGLQECVVAAIESSELHEKHKIAMKSWKMALLGTNKFDNSLFSDFEADSTQYRLLYSHYVDALQSIAEEFGELVGVVENEISTIYGESIDKLIQERVFQVIQVETTLLDDITDIESFATSGLEATVAYARAMLEDGDELLISHSNAQMILSRLDVAIDLRCKFVIQQYDEISDCWLKGHFSLLLNADFPLSTSTTTRAACDALKTQAEKIIFYSLGVHLEKKYHTFFATGGIKFENYVEKCTTSCDTSSASYYILDDLQVKILKSKCIGELPPRFTDIFPFLLKLNDTRVIFGTSESAVRKRSSFDALNDSFYRLSDNKIVKSASKLIEAEFSELQLVLKYEECLDEMKRVLSSGSAQPYIIPHNGILPTDRSSKLSRKRTASAAPLPTSSNVGGTGMRAKSMSFDLGFSGPLNYSTPGGLDIEDILHEDGFMVSDASINTSDMDMCLNKVRDLQELLLAEDEELPDELQNYFSVIDKLRSVRESIQNGDWINAYHIAKSIKLNGSVKLVPQIEHEIDMNWDKICNYAAILSCQIALTKGQPIGPIGQIDFKSSITTQLLEEAISLCQNVGCNSKRIEALFTAVLVILDLRKAQKLGDWAEIKNVLTRAYNENIGQGMSEVCFAEINRAIIEKDNHENIQALKSAIMNEEMFTKESLLDVEQISIKELSSAVTKVSNMPEDTRGTVLKTLHALSDTILKARKSAMQRQWFLLESLVAVLKETIEQFQDELDGKGGSRKGMSFVRTSSFHRGTMLHLKDKNKSSIMVGAGDFPGGAPQSARGIQWEEFAELNQSIKREIKAIDHHFAVTALEQQLVEVLNDHGIIADPSSSQIEKSAIQVDKLREVLDQATNLDMSNLSLPKHLKAYRKVGLMILDIRHAVINDQWDSMGSLLESTLSVELSHWPEYSRQELRAVRAEVENRWIISNLTTAIESGKLITNDAGDPQLAQVGYSHFGSAISAAEAMRAKTEVAVMLLNSAKRMEQLRRMLVQKLKPETYILESGGVDIPTDLSWERIKSNAKEIMVELESQKLNPMIHAEVKLIADTAEERIISDSLEQALKTGRPTGEPGNINLTKLSVKDLEKAYQQAIRSSSSKTDHAKQLLFICRSLQKLREALQRAEVAFNSSGNGKESPRDLSFDTWNIIQVLLVEILDAQKLSQLDNDSTKRLRKNSMIASVWEICEEEISLISKHAHIVELRNSLIDTAIRASHAYAERNSITITDDLETHQLHSEKLKDLCDDLDRVVSKANENSFQSDYFAKYMSCAITLRSYRLAIVAGNWRHLEDLVNNDALRSNLRVLPEVEKELAWILCELHNNSAISIIRTALNPKNIPHLNESVLGEVGINGMCPSDMQRWDLSNLHNMSFKERNEKLKEAVREAKKYKITSKVAQQWLECCENMFLLRYGLEMHDQHHLESVKCNQVTQTLRWFKDNAHICPLYVKFEAQSAYVMYQNDLLVHGLTRALQEGKPVGKCGEVQTHLIETKAIEELLNQAKDIHPRLNEVEELVQAAELSLSIRNALKQRDMKTLQSIVEDLSYSETAMSLLVVDEVAVARAELDNEIVVHALIDALRSFEDTESKALDFTFLNAEGGASEKLPSGKSMANTPIRCGQHDESSEYSEDVETSSGGNKKTPAYSILQSFSERRYSFANKNSAHIDPDTIDIDVLDYGLRMARDHGVFSDKANRLFRTVTLIRSLRVALKNSEWLKLEEILSQAKFEENIDNSVFDVLANKEIQALKSQLEIRAAIVDLSKALKVGWAKCSHGIVDTSQMNNALLADAIERADHCIVELALNIEKSTILEKENNPDDAHEASKLGVNKKKVKFHDDPMSLENSLSETSVQQQVKLLMESAKLVLKIREILAMGDIEQAGHLAEEGLSHQSLHYTVLDELKLYAKEINAALSSMKIIEDLRKSMKDSKLFQLEHSLQKAFRHDIHVGNDLGLICILSQAERQFYQLVSIKKQLAGLIESECDQDKLHRSIQFAEKLQYTDEELALAKFRHGRLRQFQEGVQFLNDFLARTTRQQDRLIVSKAIINYARSLQLFRHPIVLRAKFLLRTNLDVYRSISLSQGILRYRSYLQNIPDSGFRIDNTMKKEKFSQRDEPRDLPDIPLLSPFPSPFYNIHTESIRIKYQYLSLSSSRSKYVLENFPNLRRPEDFALRMNVLSEELKKQMLSYTEQPLPTSLSKLSPAWAAIATFVFTNHVRGLERNLFTHNENLLQQLIQLGQQAVLLRDEIYLQILKQLRGNPDNQSCKRLWKILCACLYHFPPSKMLESYLELFLIKGSEPPPPPEPPAVPEKKINRGISTKINNTITVNTSLNATIVPPSDIDPFTFVPFARCGIRCLHQTVFFHGYDSVISSTDWLTSTNIYAHHKRENENSGLDAASLKPWFSDDFYTKFFASYKERGDKAKEIVDTHFRELSNLIKPSMLNWDCSKPAAYEFPHIDLTLDAAFTNPMANGSNSKPLHNTLRGTREDWIARFDVFNASFPNQYSNESTGGVGPSKPSKTVPLNSPRSVRVTRSHFCNAIASTLTNSKPSSYKSDGLNGRGAIVDTPDMDFFDRDIMYFILLGKRMSGRSHVFRELKADSESFHFINEDESIKSRDRRIWIESNFSMTEFSSELFFSQLQTSDLIMYAERFWDNVVSRMARECICFPQSDSTLEVSIGWELYRELILTGMKKYLELFQVKPSSSSNI